MRKIVQITANGSRIFGLTSDGDVLVAALPVCIDGRPLRWTSIYSGGTTDGDSLQQGVPRRDSSVEIPIDTALSAASWAARINVTNPLRQSGEGDISETLQYYAGAYKAT